MGKALSIYRKPSGEAHFHEAYDKVLQLWPEVESIFIETEYSKTHVLVIGPTTAPPLVLLHGMTLSSTVWYKNIAYLSTFFRIYCIDIPADFGKSSIKKILKTQTDYISFFNQLIKSLKLKDYSLVGHSFGGFLALTYALSSPIGLKKLILLSPAGSIYPLPFKFYVRTMPPAIFPSKKRVEGLCNYFLAKNNKLDDIIEDEYLNQLVVSFKNCFPKNQILARVFKDDELKSLKMPTLFIVGEEEVIYKASRVVKRVQDTIPNIETKIISNAGHMLICEQPEVVNEAIVTFLKQ